MLLNLPVVHGAHETTAPTHPMHPTPGSPPNPHFTRLGGEEAIARLVDRFYFHMDTRPEAVTIRAMHEGSLDSIKRVLRLYLIEWTGGPANYSAERGHPRLRMRHARFALDAAARDAWMSCMRLALAEVVADEALRAELDDKFFKLADFLQNAGPAGAGGAGHHGR